MFSKCESVNMAELLRFPCAQVVWTPFLPRLKGWVRRLDIADLFFFLILQ